MECDFCLGEIQEGEPVIEHVVHGTLWHPECFEATDVEDHEVQKVEA